MEFTPALTEATLIKRYKRFLADIRLPDGKVIVAHVPNSGSMLGVSDPESPCLVSISNNPTRKLPMTLEFVKTKSGAWVGVNTANTNKLAREAFDKKLVPDWIQFDEIQAEVKINSASRLDFLLSNKNKKRYVEVKNISMSEPPVALFPDAVTERGQKHLKELMKLVDEGFETELFFVVQRMDCEIFKPAHQIDPVYAKLLKEAQEYGVKVSCWACRITKGEVKIHRAIEISEL